MKPYADTNFFTRVYLSLPESKQADRLVEIAKTSRAPLLPITWLHRMELANAFELSVWLSNQGGQPWVTPHNAAVAFETFKTELETETFLCSATVAISPRLSLFVQPVP